MATSHPHISGHNNIREMIERLKKSFPESAVINAQTVKQYGIAPKNESHVINALHFIGIIDADGKAVSEKHDIFFSGADFEKNFSEVIKSAYYKLFDLYGEEAWTLDDLRLISFFRTTDKTSEVIGKRQAKVFQVFASLCGKIDEQVAKAPKAKKKSDGAGGAVKSKKKQPVSPEDQWPADKSNGRFTLDNLGMSIKIEVNLPAGADQQTYDHIFKSIRENLING